MSVNAPWTDLNHPIIKRFLDKYGSTAGNDASDNPVTDDEMTDLILVASNLLNDLVGGKYPGATSDTYRPNRSGCCLSLGRPRSGCRWVREIELPFYPAVEIVTVTVDGLTVDPSLYRLEDQKWLMQLPDADGRYTPENAWPCCQRVDLPVTEAETMQVEYRWGEGPPMTGERAAARWATELAIADVDPSECGMNRELITVSRQGSTYQLRGRSSLIEAVRNGSTTGMDDVDNFLAAELGARAESGGNFIDSYAVAMSGRPYRRTTPAPSP